MTSEKKRKESKPSIDGKGKYKFTFTPAPDMFLEKYGVYVALVFGRIRRYCEMQEGICKASQQSIADWLGITRWTVSRGLKKLIEDGYIIDKTPNRRFKPHIYEATSKLEDENEAWLEAKRIAKAEKYEAENSGEKFAGDSGISVAMNPMEAAPTRKAQCGSEPHGVELRTPRGVAKNPMEWGSEPLKESIKETLEESNKEKKHTTISKKPATNKISVGLPASSSLDESNSNEVPGDDIPAVSVSSRDSASVKNTKDWNPQIPALDSMSESKRIRWAYSVKKRCWAKKRGYTAKELAALEKYKLPIDIRMKMCVGGFLI